MTLKQAITKLTINPAKVLGLDKGTLKVGADADVIVVNPKASWTVDPTKFASKSKNSPFIGQELNGQVLYTIVGGKVVVQDGRLMSNVQ